MSDAIDSTGAASGANTAAAAAVTASGGTPAAAAAASQMSSSTKVKDMDSLKTLPGGEEVLNAVMIGLATTICTNMKHNQEDLKEMQRKARDEAEA